MLSNDSSRGKWRDSDSDLFNRAIHLYENANFKEARAIFEHLYNKQSEEVEDWHLLQWIGECSYYMGDSENAILVSKKALDMLPSDLDSDLFILRIMNILALSYYVEADFHHSIEYYNLAEEYLENYGRPDYPTSRYLFRLGKGRCLFYLGSYKMADVQFKKAIDEVRNIEPFEDDKIGNEHRCNLIYFELMRNCLHMGELNSAEDYSQKIETSELEENFWGDYFYYFLKIQFLNSNYSKIMAFYDTQVEKYIDRKHKQEYYFILGAAFFQNGEFEISKDLLIKAKNVSTTNSKLSREISEYLVKIEER